MPCIRLEVRTLLLLLPTIVGLLLDRRTTRKQIKTITPVASLGLDIKMRAITPVLQEVTTTTTKTHGTSSKPNFMDDLRMKLIDSRPSGRT